MASLKIAIICNRASRLLLENFSKGAGGWGFCRAMANYSEILMALLADDSKVLL